MSGNNVSRDSSCIFCKIIDKQIPSNMVQEDDNCIVIRDINPQAPQHLLVIPKDHIPNIGLAKEQTALGNLFQKAASIAQTEKLTGGYRIVVNTGDDGGQTVHHLHIHVLGGRAMGWPPG